MKKLLAISILLLSLCNMNVVRCALMRLGDDSGDGMSRVVVSEDAELRDQAEHAKKLSILPQGVIAIIDGYYAAGPHLLPRIEALKLVFGKHGTEGVKISTKKGKIFLPVKRDLKLVRDLFGDSTGLFGVITCTPTRCGPIKKRSLMFIQETYVNGLPQNSISCCITSEQSFSSLTKAKAACMQEIETAEGKKEFQIFTPLIEGEEEAYSVPCWYSFDENKSALLRKISFRGYVASLAAIAIPFQVKNEKKTKKRKREAANPSLLFDH